MNSYMIQPEYNKTKMYGMLIGGLVFVMVGVYMAYYTYKMKTEYPEYESGIGFYKNVGGNREYAPLNLFVSGGLCATALLIASSMINIGYDEYKNQ